MGAEKNTWNKKDRPLLSQWYFKIDLFTFDDSEFDTLNTLMKLQIRISGSLLNLSFSDGSIVQHLKQERETFVQ